MTSWDLGVLARAAGAEMVGGALPLSVDAVGTDSRSLPPGALFVALRGDRFDGHAFVRDVVARGAKAVMIDRAALSTLGNLGVPALVVADTLVGLGDVARAIRRQHAKPVAGVTGSNGKTTTKELIAAAMASRGPVHKTAGNLNNLVGLPLTVAAWPTSAWAAVLEMGMNAPGEIARLVSIAEPQVGLITNVGPAHLAGLGTIEDVGRAKAELYAGLPERATAVINADDPVVAAVAVPCVGMRQRLWFGTDKRADVRLLDVKRDGQASHVALSVLGHPFSFTLPLPGAHNAMNAAAAVAVAVAMGVDAEGAIAGLAHVAVPGGRMRPVYVAGRGIHVIDDTYNANPASMRAAFDAFAGLATGRRVAVLGDMFELGPTAPALHFEVGKNAADAGLAWVLTVGENAAQIARGVRENGGVAQHFGGWEELLSALDEGLSAGDWVLVKGSRGMRMERAVAHLEGRQG